MKRPNSSLAVADLDRPHDLTQGLDPELLAEAARYASKSKSKRTLETYAWAWGRFTSWCSEQGRSSLPALPEVVAMFIATEARRGVKPATISIIHSAIASAHRLARLPLPTEDERVRAVLAGIRREHGVACDRKAALTIDVLRRVCATLGDDTIEARDRALLTLGFAIAARRSELVGLDARDIAVVERGLIVTIRVSKTDQEQRGTQVPVGHGASKETCPVRAVEAWLAASGVVDGPLLRGVDRHGNVGEARLDGRAVARVVQRRVAQVLGDEAAAAFSGHSLRAGMITTAAMAGVPSHMIREISRHASTAILESTYVRPARIWDRDLVQRCGL